MHMLNPTTLALGTMMFLGSCAHKPEPGDFIGLNKTQSKNGDTTHINQVWFLGVVESGGFYPNDSVWCQITKQKIKNRDSSYNMNLIVKDAYPYDASSLTAAGQKKTQKAAVDLYQKFSEAGYGPKLPPTFQVAPH